MSAPTHRRPLVAANWKMNLLAADAAAFCRRLVPALAGRAAEVVVFPSFPLLPAVAAGLAGTAAAWGGQDLHPEDSGAHTGDVSGAQLADAGCAWALCGHSERRRDHGEDDTLVARKVAAAVRAGLKPVVCLGETREERRAEATWTVLDRQLAPLELVPGLVLAYEPVWAIGTGDTATPAQAREAHGYLRRRLVDRFGGAGRAVRILYGGSVTPDNAGGLAAQPDVDGALVGGASLDSARFLAIISAFAAR